MRKQDNDTTTVSQPSAIDNDAKMARDLKFVDRAVKLQDRSAVDRDELGFSTPLWAQISLPYNEPVVKGQDGKALIDHTGAKVAPQWWNRRNGNIDMTLRPAIIRGADGIQTPKYPYGVIPRYLITWMITEAMREKSPVLSMGKNLSEFMDKLGMKRTGGKNGTITRIRDQSKRLFLSSITVETTRTNGDLVVDSGLQWTFARGFELFFSNRDPEGEPLWNSTVELSAEFFESIMDSGFPVDLGALGALGGSPMKIDIYLWLAARAYRVKHPTLISWGLLAQQFGSEADPRKFREVFKRNLNYALAVYPKANVEVQPEGLVLRRSAPAIPFKQK